jgi:endonuclease/exonuclease/phosphatase family metal-dependent hydrolase
MSNRTKNRTKNRRKNRRKNRTKHIQKGGTIPRTLEALTYNLSWASQAKVIDGSEADFVEKCKSKKRDCYGKAIEKIGVLHRKHKFDVLGIQEVQHVDLVTAIMKETTLTGWYRGATWNSIAKVYSGCALIWNTDTLGTMVSGKTINLVKPDKDNKCDARTCCIVTTSKDINLIVAHFPWINEQGDIEAITDIINEHISSNGPIIILVDANDSNTFISKDNPLIIKNKKLSHGLSQDQAKAHLKTCCWHKKDHKYSHFTDTGDYILSENVLKIGVPPEMKTPSNEQSEEHNLYSDHMPVLATIALTRNSLTTKTRIIKSQTIKNYSTKIDNTNKTVTKKGIADLAKYEAIALAKNEAIALAKYEAIALAKNEGIALAKNEGIALAKNEPEAKDGSHYNSLYKTKS